MRTREPDLSRLWRILESSQAKQHPVFIYRHRVTCLLDVGLGLVYIWTFHRRFHRIPDAKELNIFMQFDCQPPRSVGTSTEAELYLRRVAILARDLQLVAQPGLRFVNPFLQPHARNVSEPPFPAPCPNPGLVVDALFDIAVGESSASFLQSADICLVLRRFLEIAVAGPIDENSKVHDFAHSFTSHVI